MQTFKDKQAHTGVTGPQFCQNWGQIKNLDETVKLSIKPPSLSSPIPSFSGTCKVRKFYYISV